MDGRVGLFHPGTQHSRQTALALQALGRLDFFATSLAPRPERWPWRAAAALPPAWRARVAAELARVAEPDLDPALVRTAGLAEWAERIARRAGAPRLAARLDAIGNRRFGRVVADALGDGRPCALWGYNGSSLHAFRAGRAAGRRLILDRTIGDWREWNRIAADLRDRHPAWFGAAERPVPPARIAEDDEEYALADLILVGSPTAAASVAAHAADRTVAARLAVLPYPYDARLFTGPAAPPARRTGPLRLLFVGQAGVRKGLPPLLAALARVPASVATLTVVGERQLPAALWAAHADRFVHRATVPRAAVPALMRDHDLLVLPSWFEGSALVLVEALAMGLGVIQTRAAGLGATPATGLVLDRPDADALEAAIAGAAADRDRVAAWAAAAPAAAAAHHPRRYRAGIAALLDVGAGSAR